MGLVIVNGIGSKVVVVLISFSFSSLKGAAAGTLVGPRSD
jgi:hypothetical protein